jgi:hypothetical protein
LWRSADLTAAAGATGFLAAGDPSGYGFEEEELERVVYRGTDNHIHCLWWQDRGRSFWDAVGGAISDVFNAIATGVEDVVNAIGEVVADIFETLGNALEDLLSAIGDLLSEIPWIGGALRAVFHWLGDIVSGVFDLIGAIVKGLLGIVAGVVAGVIRIVGGGIGGLLAWDGRLFVKGWGDILSGIGGAVVVILGKAVAVIQQVIPLQWGERELTDDEREILERVFRGSVALYNVRIIEGFAGIYSINDRPFTLGNTIYMKDRDPATNPALLVHECLHVWQYQQRGTRYATDALAAQAFVDDAYDWEDEIRRGNIRWEDFNAEAQGRFFQDLYLQGELLYGPSHLAAGSLIATGNGVFYDADSLLLTVGRLIVSGVNRTSLADAAVEAVRDSSSFRLSGIWS